VSREKRRETKPLRERLAIWRKGFARIVRGLLDADPAAVEKSTLELSQRSRWLAPLTFAAGAVAMTVVGIKPLIRNWRLTLVEIVPAGWLWISMYSLKHHVIDGTEVKVLKPTWYLPVLAIYLAVGVIAFWCNAMFAVALATNDRSVRTAAREAWRFKPLLLTWGFALGGAYAFNKIVMARHGAPAYDISQSIVIAFAMITFVTVPARIAGITAPPRTPRDKVASIAVRSTMAAAVSTPGFILDRIGLLLLGVSGLHWLGFVLLSMGIAFQMAGTTSSRAVRLSTLVISSTDPDQLPNAST
jgi:hypothetical protein